jgi:hypothetical protein
MGVGHLVAVPLGRGRVLVGAAPAMLNWPTFPESSTKSANTHPVNAPGHVLPVTLSHSPDASTASKSGQSPLLNPPTAV